jgi:hypothetical protein
VSGSDKLKGHTSKGAPVVYGSTSGPDGWPVSPPMGSPSQNSKAGVYPGAAGSVNARKSASRVSEVSVGHPSVESRKRMPRHTHLVGAAVHSPREASHNPLGSRKGKRKSQNADAGKY